LRGLSKVKIIREQQIKFFSKTPVSCLAECLAEYLILFNIYIINNYAHVTRPKVQKKKQEDLQITQPNIDLLTQLRFYPKGNYL
jgi:hypothetical protein